jgi:hypothetical protein
VDIEAAILCDAATVREGLLHVLGGAITRMWRPTLPAPLGIAFATILSLDRDEGGTPHEVAISIRNEAHVVAELMGAVQAGALGANLEAGEVLLAPLAFPLHQVGTDRYGRHTLTMSVDAGAARREVAFWVLHPDEQRLPPIA